MAIVFNAGAIRTWSVIGSRATYGLAILELGQTIDNLLVMSGDTSTSAGLDRFKKTFPNKYLDVGIAEQNMMGIAAGFASEGNTVFTSTFSPFQTLRCCEQIKVNLGYMGHKVNMVGLASGVVLGSLGFTHCSIEDVAVMRSLGGISVIAPADCTETVKATLAAPSYPGSVYIRLTGGAKNPAVYQEDYHFEIGKAVVLREANDVTLVACGTMVHEALKSADLLSQAGIQCGVINMHTIKPLDTKCLEQVCARSKLVVSLEEHSVVGGLGAAIAEYKTTLKGAPPQLILGLPNHYGKAGDYSYLLEQHGLKAEAFARSIQKRYEEIG